MKTQIKNNFDELVQMSENLIHSINELEMSELQDKVAQYANRMEDHFLVLKSRQPTHQIVEELKQMIIVHEKITSLFNQNRVNVSTKLKKLYAGKQMQNTYP